jgi:hypothetical protein
MELRWKFFRVAVWALTALALSPRTLAQSSSTSSSSAKHVSKRTQPDSAIDAGTVTNGVYRNKTLAFSCNIPPGWVLRTDEMNARDEEPKEEKPEDKKPEDKKEDKPDSAQPPNASSAGARVLLAAFSRPPEAKGEEVNSSILIAAESASSYPGLTEAAQYFGPLIEVAKAQGFTLEEDPYAIAIGVKTLVRADFHKDVGTRVMHQSTLAMLSHGYAVSITLIAGTDDDVEDLVDGLTFNATGK